MKRLCLLSLCLLVGILGAKAQVGYQIALLNSATGEARANETVSVVVSLTNNAGEEILNETKQATTNDFGVLSLSIGDANTFVNADLTKMPFFIEVSADGVMIGKSQILSVPVAEVTKRLAPIDKKLIVGTWSLTNDYGHTSTIVFNEDNTGYQTYYKDDGITYFSYEIEGNSVYAYSSDGLEVYRFFNGALYEVYPDKKWTKQ